jgi:hypothetical protein
MGKEPLEKNNDLVPLKNWSISAGLRKLVYFSLWVNNGKWIGWKSLSPP